jgi:adenosylcobinamide-phosphate synthase
VRHYRDVAALVPRLPARATGLALGFLADWLVPDPGRGHPVAVFGQAAASLERRLYADSRVRGGVFTAVCLGVPVVAAAATERGAAGPARARAVVTALTTALVTWAVLGGRSLAHEGVVMARHLEAAPADPLALDAARHRLRNLCARDASDLDAPAMARATVESLAENTSDAVVAPLLWGAVAGVPGLVGYRAVNTLDAMIGYHSDRYERFGWAAARLDDLLNLVPSRVTGGVTVLCAPLVSGSSWRAWQVLRRDASAHPSPNAGYPEAAAAGALGVRLGGRNVYGGRVEVRPAMGDGHVPRVADVRRAVRLQQAVGAVAAALSVLLAWIGSHARQGGARV